MFWLLFFAFGWMKSKFLAYHSNLCYCNLQPKLIFEDISVDISVHNVQYKLFYIIYNIFFWDNFKTEHQSKLCSYDVPKFTGVRKAVSRNLMESAVRS